MNHPLDQKRTVTLEQLDRWRTILREVTPADEPDAANLQRLLDGIVAVWGQAQPKVDVAHAEAERTKAADGISRVQEEILSVSAVRENPESLHRRANGIAHFAVHHQLWSDVLGSGWDTAAQRVMEYYHDTWMVPMADQQEPAKVQARAAQTWWRKNYRRALAEGLDVESLAAAMM